MADRKGDSKKFATLMEAEGAFQESEDAQYVLLIPDGNGGYEAKAFKNDDELNAFLDKDENKYLQDQKGLKLATRDQATGEIEVSSFDAAPAGEEAEKDIEKTKQEIAGALNIEPKTFDEVLQERQKEVAAIRKELRYTTGSEARAQLEAEIEKKEKHIAKMEAYAEKHPDEVGPDKHNGLFVEMAAESEITDFEASNYIAEKNKQYAQGIKDLIAQTNKKGKGEEDEISAKEPDEGKENGPEEGETVASAKIRPGKTAEIEPEVGSKDDIMAALTKGHRHAEIALATDQKLDLPRVPNSANRGGHDLV